MASSSSMRCQFLHRLGQGATILFDGAMGTFLMEQGLKRGCCPEEWNLLNPQKVMEIHRRYRDAGAQVLETNTFGGNRWRLHQHGLGDEVRRINIAGAQLAREVAQETCFVAGSVGPTGQFLEPSGDVSEENMLQMYSEQIAALLEGSVDLVCVETMGDLREARLAIRAAKELADVPVIASMTFRRGNKGFHTIMGNGVESVIRGLTDQGAEVVGSNCGTGPDEMGDLMREMLTYDPPYLITQPNAGLPQIRGGRVFYPDGPERLADFAEEMVSLGVRVIGGCCGTGPEHVAAMVMRVASLGPR